MAFTCRVAVPSSVSVIEFDADVKMICGFVSSIPATAKVSVVLEPSSVPSFALTTIVSVAELSVISSSVSL